MVLEACWYLCFSAKEVGYGFRAVSRWVGFRGTFLGAGYQYWLSAGGKWKASLEHHPLVVIERPAGKTPVIRSHDGVSCTSRHSLKRVVLSISWVNGVTIFDSTGPCHHPCSVCLKLPALKMRSHFVGLLFKRADGRARKVSYISPFCCALERTAC